MSWLDGSSSNLSPVFEPKAVKVGFVLVDKVALGQSLSE